MNEKMRQVLEELRDEIRRIGPANPDLHALQAKVTHALEAGGHLPVVEEIRESAGKIEARYPQLTAILNNVMNSLSNIGI